MKLFIDALSSILRLVFYDDLSQPLDKLILFLFIPIKDLFFSALYLTSIRYKSSPVRAPFRHSFCSGLSLDPKCNLDQLLLKVARYFFGVSF